ncbi:MAG: 3-hydroxyacyl-CoA dehydrogenase NAD-binding domain-containing protein [Spirosomataceae bacterium]
MNTSVLVLGEGRLVHSVTACLLRGGHSVTMVHDPPQKATTLVQQHIRTSDALLPSPIQPGNLEVFASPTSLNRSFSLVILVTKDLVEEKLNAIASIEPLLNPDAIVAVNMESITLQELQPHVQAPERVIGLNWVEPAHTSFFLEIIGNVKTDKKVMEEIDRLGKSWGKDPYTIEVGFSVRARLHAALTREALFLVRSGYADFEDIDRNCRNDAGYYLPFTGNMRYMDLMGTSAYGIVMKDLNPSLSKQQALDDETIKLAQSYPLGMRSGKGFFEYSPEEVEEWERKMETFSYQIHHLMKKYPFE